MTESALLGTPPANEVDFDVVKGLLDLFDMPGDPSKGVVIPPSAPPNRDYANKGPGSVAEVSIAILSITIVTGGRLFARYTHLSSRLGWDDALIVVAAACAIALLSVIIAMVIQGGSGQHIYNITYYEYNLWLRYGSIDEILFFITVGITKLSIVCFNWRLTEETSKAWQRTHKVFFVVISTYLSIAVFVPTFQCNPPEAARNLIVYGQNAGHVKCLSVNALGVTLSALHIAFDWMLLSIPMTFVFQLSIPPARKLRAAIPLSVGVMSCVGSVMRLYYQLHPPPDLTFNWTPQLNWTIVDIVTAVCVTSLPSLNLLITKHLPRKIRKYWGGRDNVDEFGHPFNEGYFFEVNQRRKPRVVRQGGLSQLFGKQNLGLKKYPTGETMPTTDGSTNSCSTTALATRQASLQKLEDDHTSLAQFVEPGEISDQSNAPHSKVAMRPNLNKNKHADPYAMPDDDGSPDRLDYPLRAKAQPVKVVESSDLRAPGDIPARLS